MRAPPERVDITSAATERANSDSNAPARPLKVNTSKLVGLAVIGTAWPTAAAVTAVIAADDCNTPATTFDTSISVRSSSSISAETAQRVCTPDPRDDRPANCTHPSSGVTPAAGVTRMRCRPRSCSAVRSTDSPAMNRRPHRTRRPGVVAMVGRRGLVRNAEPQRCRSCTTCSVTSETA